MHYFGEKIEIKTFLVDVWLERGEGKKISEAQIFSLQAYQNVLSPK